MVPCSLSSPQTILTIPLTELVSGELSHTIHPDIVYAPVVRSKADPLHAITHQRAHDQEFRKDGKHHLFQTISIRYSN